MKKERTLTTLLHHVLTQTCTTPYTRPIAGPYQIPFPTTGLATSGTHSFQAILKRVHNDTLVESDCNACLEKLASISWYGLSRYGDHGTQMHRQSCIK